jgi:hypothetical protein
LHQLQALTEGGGQAARGYLRGKETLQLQRPLTGCGWRTAKQKSCYLLSERGGKLKVVLTMLTVAADGSSPVALNDAATTEQLRHLRSFLLGIEHPFVASMTDLDFIKVCACCKQLSTLRQVR